MGNTHSSKPPDRGHHKHIPPNKSGSNIKCNVPYLTTLFNKMTAKGDGKQISQEEFENAFSGPLKVLGKLVYKHIKAAQIDGPCSGIKLDEFLTVSSEIMSLVSNTTQLHYYFDVFSEGKPSMVIEELYHMVQVCLSVSLSIAYLPYSCTSRSESYLRALASSMHGENENLTREDFEKWADTNIPNLFNGVHSFLLIKLSGAEFDDMAWHKRMSQRKNCQGNLPKESLSMLAYMDNETVYLSYSSLWLLSSILPTTYVTAGTKAGISMKSTMPAYLKSRLQQLVEHQSWCLLFNSDRDGLSQNGFENHVFDYTGPTIMIISFHNNCYVLATEQEWKESSQCWGSDSTILVQLLPRLKVIDHGRLVFLNLHTRGPFKGIQLGSNPKTPVMRIKDFTSVEHYGVDVPLDFIEVWGCAKPETRQQQLKHRAWERKEAEKHSNRKLKAEDWADNPDRMLLDWAGVRTDHHENAGE